MTRSNRHSLVPSRRSEDAGRETDGEDDSSVLSPVRCPLSSDLAILYIRALPDGAWMGAGGKVFRFHRKAWALDGPAATASRGGQAQGRDREAPFRAARLGRPARSLAREGADGAGFPRRAQRRLQHQCRHHHARFRQCPHVLLVHARRRDGPRRDDGLAQPHHRSGSRDVSRAALGGRRGLGAVRRIFQQRHAVSLLAAAPVAQAARAARRQGHGLHWWAWRSSGTSRASRRIA